MGDYYFLKVPVKPHIYKFITATEGPEVIIRKQSFFWYIVRPYLKYKLNSGHKKSVDTKTFSCDLKIRVPINKVKNYGLFLQDNSILYIDKVLSIYFGKELTAYVRAYCNKEGRYKGYNSAIEDFCKKHGIIIDEDISLDALKKIDFRYRKKVK